MLRLIDSLFDRVAQRLAENMCSNMDLVEQNREARCQEEVSNRDCRRGASKYKAAERESMRPSLSDAYRVTYEPSVFVA